MTLIFFHTENLATEIEVWKDMKKIKHLPAPLSQKKAMRLQYQVHLIMRYFLIITACVKHNTHDTKRVHNIHMFLLLLFSEMSQD